MADAHYMSRRALWLSRLSDEVVRGVADRIRTGDLPPGEPLPERDILASEFVTSLGVIDRAIATLLAEGLVARDADGAPRVAAAPRREGRLEIRLSEDATRADVLSILELRIGVESEAAALAAERRTEAQLTAIRSAQAAFVTAATEGTQPAQADFQFHRAISEASGNPYIGELTEHLGPLLIPRMRVPLATGGRRDPNLEAARAEHDAIVAAIADADPVAARRAMRDHLTRSLELVRRPDASAPSRDDPLEST